MNLFDRTLLENDIYDQLLKNPESIIVGKTEFSRVKI